MVSLPRRPRRRPAPAVAVLLLLLLVALPACSGDDDDAAAPAPDAPPAPTTTTVPPVFPLTGLPADDAAKLGRPALAIKIENGAQARPQSGLDVADVVYEEVIEGGETRFVGLFHSSDADVVGPVRSVRPSDPDIVAPFAPLFGYSGGIPAFIEKLRAVPGLTDVGVDRFPGEYPRRRGRPAPHNQYTSTPALFSKAPAGAKPPPRLAEFLPAGQPFAAGGAAPATHIDLAVGRTAVAYDFDAGSGTWKRTNAGTPHTVEGGGQIAPTNVIVQLTPYAGTGQFDQSRTEVEVANTIGTGDAIILSGGMVVRGKYSKSSAGALTTWTDASGAPIRLLPGRTWVELPRAGTATNVR